MGLFRRRNTPKTLRRVPRPPYNGEDSPWERKRPSIFESQELPAMSPICSGCRHWHLGSTRACAAFPGRRAIPLDIWLGHNPHTSPVPGDHGIQFEDMEPWGSDDAPSAQWVLDLVVEGPYDTVPIKGRPGAAPADGPGSVAKGSAAGMSARLPEMDGRGVVKAGG